MYVKTLWRKAHEFGHKACCQENEIRLADMLSQRDLTMEKICLSLSPSPSLYRLKPSGNVMHDAVSARMEPGQLLEKGFMSEELFDKIASEVIEHKDEISRVQLNELGEPLLDKKIAERIRRFKDGGIREVLLITNGALLDERKAVEILEAGVDILRCSITTINSEKYPLLRRGLNLETVLANINRYIELRDAHKQGFQNIYFYGKGPSADR